MRRLLLLPLLLPMACDPGERAPELAVVQQATTDDGKADSVFGQPDLNTATLPSGTTQSSLAAPVGIGASSSPVIWIPDREANRVVGLYVGAALPSYLAGQSSWITSNPAAGVIGLSSPSAVALTFTWIAIADAGNNRVLLGNPTGFPIYPSNVFGQSGSFETNDRNKWGLSADSMAAPSGVAFDDSFSPGRLMVSDTGNHRVLVFALGPPPISTTALTCLGQLDCKSGSPNRGGAPSADGFSEPRGIAMWFDPKNTADPWRGFYVADSANHRVLHYKVFSTSADFVYGQGDDFGSAVPSKGGPSATSLRNPTAVAVERNGSLWVADTGHHRVLHFPKGKNVADRVLGQPDFTTVAPPTTVSATSLRAPEGVAVASNGDVYVADTGHHRVVRFIKPCDVADCDDGNPCTDDRCDALAGCVHEYRTYSRECTPYRCDSGTQKCIQPCTATAGCLPPYVCQSGVCVLRCVDDSACASTGRVCADGFCCNKRCSGPCESCAYAGAEGSCRTAFAGKPPTGHTCDGPTGDCGARCNGADASHCTSTPAGTACGVEGCIDGVALVAGKCDGAGSCHSGTKACAPYACAANGCRDSCFGDHECTRDARCVDGACVPLSQLHGSGGCTTGAPRGAFGGFAALLALAALCRRRR